MDIKRCRTCHKFHKKGECGKKLNNPIKSEQDDYYVVINPNSLEEMDNLDIILDTKGNGSLERNIPDQTNIGGNSRGKYAIDLQKTRSNNFNVASGDYSVILGGDSNTSNGFYSTTGGQSNYNSGDHSFTSGGINCNILADKCGTLSGEGLTLTSDHSFAIGKFNLPGDIGGPQRIFMIGNGNIDSPSNLFSITSNGSVNGINSFLGGNGVAFAQYFESDDGRSIPIGTSICFSKGSQLIRPTILGENPIGVICDSATFITNAASEEYSHKYEVDKDGNFIYKDIEIEEYKVLMEEKEIMIQEKYIDIDHDPPTVTYREIRKKIKVPIMIDAIIKDDDGGIIESIKIEKVERIKKIVKQKVLSKKYDPTKKYIPRQERKEWNIVGILGITRILKNQIINNNWVKISEGDKYDTYFIK